MWTSDLKTVASECLSNCKFSSFQREWNRNEQLWAKENEMIQFKLVMFQRVHKSCKKMWTAETRREFTKFISDRNGLDSTKENDDFYLYERKKLTERKATETRRHKWCASVTKETMYWCSSNSKRNSSRAHGFKGLDEMKIQIKLSNYN